MTALKTRYIDSHLHLFYLLLAAVAYLYFNLFYRSHIPFLLGGDQVYFWMDAQRMLAGGRIYQEFFQFTPPGTDLIFLALFKLFGLKVWVTNSVIFALGLALCGLCFTLANRIMSRNSSLLAAVLFLVFIYGRLLNATHHWFSVLAIIVAVAIITAKTITYARCMIAGACLGVASFFTQTHGAAALCAFAVFLLWQRSRAESSWRDLLRSELLLFFGFAAALSLLSTPLLLAIGWRQLWYFQITYVRSYIVPFDQGGFFGLPGPLSWRTFLKLSPYLAVYVLPIVYPITLWRCRRQRNHTALPWEQITLLFLVGLFLLVEVSFSLNWLRLFSVSIAGVILLIWLCDQSRRFSTYAVPCLWAASISFGLFQTVATHHHQSTTIQLPAGEVATNPQAADKLRWVMQHTSPGEFFFQAPWPGMYVPLHLRNPAFVDQILPGEGTRPQEIALTIQQLEQKQVKYVLWAKRLDSMSDLSVHPKDLVTPLREYLHARYIAVRVFPDGDQIWQRNDTMVHP